MEDNRFFIRRYTNRKMYLVNESTYVTASDVANLVRQGVNVKVVDHKTKNDLTQPTLINAIWEQEKNNINKLPVETLREVIKAGSFTQYISQFSQNA